MTSPDSLSKAVEAWKEHPVTEQLKMALRWQLDRRREAITQSYWQGNEATDGERLALLRLEDFWADLFESSAEDLQSVLESMNDE